VHHSITNILDTANLKQSLGWCSLTKRNFMPRKYDLQGHSSLLETLNMSQTSSKDTAKYRAYHTNQVSTSGYEKSLSGSRMGSGRHMIVQDKWTHVLLKP